jgi:peptide-methionine (S)-S-oxide reductase
MSGLTKAAVALLGSLLGATACNAKANPAVAIPAAAVDAPRASTTAKQTAVFSGGCFWGVQAVFQHVTGVVSATSGYSGGSAKTAEYETVSTGETGHVNPWRSSTILRRSPTESSCGSSFRLRTIRHN